MAKKLTPRNLDVVITKITAKTVTYELYANSKEEKWRVPANSTFNKATLQVGQRYHVTTRVIPGKQWNGTKQVVGHTYDWVTATAPAPKAKLQALTQKQRIASASLAAMPVVDNGELFIF
jgi:hypothetical protein